VFARFPIADGEKTPNKLPLEPMLPDRLELEKLLEGPLNDMVRIRGAFEQLARHGLLFYLQQVL